MRALAHTHTHTHTHTYDMHAVSTIWTRERWRWSNFWSGGRLAAVCSTIRDLTTNTVFDHYCIWPQSDLVKLGIARKKSALVSIIINVCVFFLVKNAELECILTLHSPMPEPKRIESVFLLRSEQISLYYANEKTVTIKMRVRVRAVMHDLTRGE
jgi:hypothetical protein